MKSYKLKMDKDLETFMQKNKQMDKLLEDELDNLIKEDAELKNLKKRKSDSIDCKFFFMK